MREGGDPAGVPVLLHGGTPNSSLLYEPHVADAAERGIRLFSYDRPGLRRVDAAAGTARRRLRADVVAICDALGVERLCVWGVSGGGPHALATAALLPDRVAAVASIASIAPYDAEGLDFTAGMGELNVESFEAIREGDEAHRAQHELEVASLAATRRRTASSRRGRRSSGPPTSRSSPPISPSSGSSDQRRIATEGRTAGSTTISCS